MASSGERSNVVWNVPNAITAFRLVLAVALFVLLPLGWHAAALAVFALAAASDYLDGWWARTFNQHTQLGRILDPFADKIVICGAFIYLAHEPASGIAAWMAVALVARELLVTMLRSLVEGQGGDFSASWAGKLKMVLQCAAVGASLLRLALGNELSPAWLDRVVAACVWCALVGTWYSGLEYVVEAARRLRAALAEEASAEAPTEASSGEASASSARHDPETPHG